MFACISLNSLLSNLFHLHVLSSHYSSHMFLSYLIVFFHQTGSNNPYPYLGTKILLVISLYCYFNINLAIFVIMMASIYSNHSLHLQNQSLYHLPSLSSFLSHFYEPINTLFKISHWTF